MQSALILLACLALPLGGCAMPDPYFRHSPAVGVTIGSDRFVVRQRGRLAEAVRVNPRYAPRLGPVGRRAALAMTRATGCRVTEIRGDASMILGLLSCSEEAPTGAEEDRRKLPPEDCEILHRWRQMGGQELALVLDCTRI
ncbi:hypothetical protein [Pseudooceanicola sp. 200-1SW]|uniref:hypothetical protein n=1 Tax=Pseudooceanicola sp. 200-1SW TaxID=3425949 RepID=UPI003D7F2517